MPKQRTSAFKLAQSNGTREAGRLTADIQQVLATSAMKTMLRTDEGLQVGPFLLKADSLDVVGQPTPEQWADIGRQFDEWGGALNWWIGDWAYYAYHTWGMGYEQIAEMTGFEYGTIKNCASVTSRIPPAFRPQSLRHDWLKWNHYVELVKAPEAQFEYWLNRTINERLSVRALRKLINPSILPEPMALADRKNKRIFNQVWRAVENGGEGLRREDIEHLERWITEVKRQLG